LAANNGRRHLFDGIVKKVRVLDEITSENDASTVKYSILDDNGSRDNGSFRTVITNLGSGRHGR
jgi:hypothetical protein